MKILRFFLPAFALLALLSAECLGLSPSVAPGAGEQWLSEWELPEGFSLQIDVEGFDNPTAIAFVPNPGNDAKSPLYFVTEIRGKVKVITQDRSVFTFAENFFTRSPGAELPSPDGETGMAGVALDPVHGFVFVSFAYMDTNRTLRNGLVRFDSKPGTFDLRAGKSTSFSELFKKDISRVAHQIGPMLVNGNELFVAVGDGGQHFKTQSLDSTLGKVLRMTLDGQPLPANPFYEQGSCGTESYVWASGLRNPFGLCMVTNRLLASENGFDVDRFLEIRRGENYHWDGTDWSIGMNSPMVFGPTVAPVQVAWVPHDCAFFPPSYRSKFFVALAGGKSFSAGIAMLDYDFASSRMASRPRQFALHLDEKQTELDPAGLALGPDGLYLVPVYPVRKVKGARGAVLRISYDPAHSLSSFAGRGDEAQRVMLRSGCFSCHGTHPNDLNVAPPLDRETLVPRILSRLRSAEYINNVKQIDSIDADPYRAYRRARRSVLKAEGMERAHLWIKYHVMEPTFDQQSSAMPNLGLTEKEAQAVADYLMRRNVGDIGVTGFFKSFAQPYLYGPAKRRHLAGAIVMGFLAGSLTVGAPLIYFLRRRRANP